MELVEFLTFILPFSLIKQRNLVLGDVVKPGKEVLATFWKSFTPLMKGKG